MTRTTTTSATKLYGLLTETVGKETAKDKLETKEAIDSLRNKFKGEKIAWQEEMDKRFTQEFKVLATKDDLAKVKSELKDDISKLKDDLSKVKSEIEGKIADTRVELEKSMADTRVALEKSIAQVRVELKEAIAQVSVELKESKSKMILWVFVFWVTQVGALVGIILPYLKK